MRWFTHPCLVGTTYLQFFVIHCNKDAIFHAFRVTLELFDWPSFVPSIPESKLSSQISTTAWSRHKLLSWRWHSTASLHGTSKCVYNVCTNCIKYKIVTTFMKFNIIMVKFIMVSVKTKLVMLISKKQSKVMLQYKWAVYNSGHRLTDQQKL